MADKTLKEELNLPDIPDPIEWLLSKLSPFAAQPPPSAPLGDMPGQVPLERLRNYVFDQYGVKPEYQSLLRGVPVRYGGVTQPMALAEYWPRGLTDEPNIRMNPYVGPEALMHEYIHALDDIYSDKLRSEGRPVTPFVEAIAKYAAEHPVRPDMTPEELSRFRVYQGEGSIQNTATEAPAYYGMYRGPMPPELQAYYPYITPATPGKWYPGQPTRPPDLTQYGSFPSRPMRDTDE